MGQHTVEKIGGTSMTRFGELMDNILIGNRKGDELYNRIFVVSAYGGITKIRKPPPRESMRVSRRATASGRTNSKRPATR